MALKVTKVL
jgi:hypothetical protein